LRIVSASYGSGPDNQRDVTSVVRTLVRGNQVRDVVICGVGRAAAAPPIVLTASASSYAGSTRSRST
jgi:hypothetical protein